MPTTVDDRSRCCRCCSPIDFSNVNVVHNVILLCSFFMATLMSIGLAGFCCAKLWISDPDAEERGTYMSLLCFVVSVWLPSPSCLLNKTTTNTNNNNQGVPTMQNLGVVGAVRALARTPPRLPPDEEEGGESDV